MFLTMMIMLGVASFIVEMMFAAKIPAWRRNAHKLKWLNMVISIGLSFVLGTAFGAKGIIAMGAAMIGTVLSIPGYAFLHWNYDSPMAQRAGGNLFAQEFAKWKTVMFDFFKVIYKILRIITAPIWITRSILSKYSAYKSRKTVTV
jgi:hypothetical protein